MAFIQAAALSGQRAGQVLSADNPPPERHIVVDLLRRAAPLLGLKPPVVATLEAMLGCLAPRRRHHTVFASNATLVFRRNGITERTLRRHVVQLIECGLLTRHDSPNRKRYTRHDPQGDQALRFGFDLTPLFCRVQEIARLAAQATQDADELAFQRATLRAAARQALDDNPGHTLAQEALRALRRKLTVAQCAAMIEVLPTPAALAPNDDCEAPRISSEADAMGTRRAADVARERNMSGSDGQNVRHYQKSKQEITEEEKPLSVAQLVEACPDAAQFSLGKIANVADVVAHAHALAPMIGIDTANYRSAQDKLGPLGAAVTVWAMVQTHARIRRAGAYFRAITTGNRSNGFDPFKLIRRLAARSGDGPIPPTLTPA